MSTPAHDPRDAEEGHQLARHVADAADAWLTDPLDTGVYARLVQATLRYRRWARPQLPDLTGERVPRISRRPTQDTELSDVEPDLPPRIGQVVPEVLEQRQGD